MRSVFEKADCLPALNAMCLSLVNKAVLLMLLEADRDFRLRHSLRFPRAVVSVEGGLGQSKSS